ncbi:caspase, EACC1-associated type [Amycolatopsis sp. H20-H5]|uniref:caspase, EACC1-associated type n=1 Tax=Amycolatopsis sp. H20-H5 TaxID=3046309 RepID=UPI002DB881F8|nr:AAA domain-containing protein [Amycolatopsis sp. H20-H5]MEC3974289.1 AAA domain-containing protein [Amycolatopsis sp. H20-H5]
MTDLWFPNGSSSRAVLIGASTFQSTELAAIPAVSDNLQVLRDTLTDPLHGLLGSEHCLVEGIGAPASLPSVGAALSRASREATDLLLVYYAGHGLLDDDGSLHLGLEDTEPRNVGYSGIPVARIKQDLGQARARARVLILDCCFSGRAIAAMSTPQALVAGQLNFTGTYTLTSSSATSPSHAPPGSRHTAFTAALLRALAEPTPLSLDEIYQHVHAELDGRGLPAPQRRATNTAGRLALVRGPATTSVEEQLDQGSDRPLTRPAGSSDLLAQVLANAGGAPAAAGQGSREQLPRREVRASARPRPAPGTDEDRAGIVQFWSMAEMFSPPPVKKVDRDKLMFAVKPGEPLPWEPDHELARRRFTDGRVWQHVVHLGIYGLDSIFDVLQSVFEPNEPSFEERPAGQSALVTFVVSAEGRPIVGSEVLSSCAWATSRVLHPGPGADGWLTGFEAVKLRFSDLFEKLVGPDSHDARAAALARGGHQVGSPMGQDLLAGCFNLAEDMARLGAAVRHGEIRVQSKRVALRNAHDTGHDFLNSMIADDLITVTEHARAGRAGAALREYLRPDSALDLGQRVDVQEDLDAVAHVTAPRHIPLGRWPSDPEHSLALGQQLAVNSALRLPATGAGIFAVNGPPGTGKTTMLRDLVAAVVVERARVLATLPRPADAFIGKEKGWVTGDRKRVIHTLVPQLTGFEIVVASANNGAVENVTNEMPARDAIDDCWREMAEELDYFAGTSSELLTADPRSTAETGDGNAGWGLLAAKLGNKDNRGRFVSEFWYRKPTPVSPADLDKPETESADKDMIEMDLSHAGLLAILKDYELTSPSCTWAEAVADFLGVLKRAESAQVKREQVYQAVTRKVTAESRVRGRRLDHAEASQRFAEARAHLAEAERIVRAWQIERDHRVSRRVENLRFKPRFLQWLTTFGRAMREWNARDQYLAGQILAAEQAYGAAYHGQARLTSDANAAGHAATTAAEAVRDAEAELNAIIATLTRGQVNLGKHFLDGSWWKDRGRRELTAPWTDTEWNCARTELFLAALRLHKAFLQHTPKEMRQTLHGTADVLAGSAPRTLPEADALAAWQALFLVVPVVSTTFSSFARMFSHLRGEALGWLLIDEAGQATPQSAVGALWRSKRAVIVGDPLQLEPITTMPFRAEQAIRQERGVDEQWSASRTSVQRLADRVTPLGTWLPGADGKTWVGAPLMVHRRCDQPMFGIANDIAYDGLMIHAIVPTHAASFAEKYPTLPESKWIDVASVDSQSHWIPAEGVQLDRILRTLAGLDFDMSEVMVIAPFRDIADRVRKFGDRYPGLVAGTIHTAQGKQADIVILVLGSDPQRPGARQWAASKPNLLNVAASRAKRRLYVIGDRRAWSNQHYFDVLAHRLPHAPPQV